jgi:hypothetical protein
MPCTAFRNGVRASAPDALNSWLPDQGSNLGHADYLATVELRVFRHSGHLSFRNFRE